MFLSALIFLLHSSVLLLRAPAVEIVMFLVIRRPSLRRGVLQNAAIRPSFRLLFCLSICPTRRAVRSSDRKVIRNFVWWKNSPFASRKIKGQDHTLAGWKFELTPIRRRLLLTKQDAQLMLTNPRDAFSGQSRSPNNTIPYVRYSFLLCNSNFVFQTRSFSDIRLQKMSWPWNPGQRSLKVIESGTIR